MCQLDGEFWQHKKWNNRYKNFKIIRLSKFSVPIDIENKRISASVISDKLALDTKDTKKEQITELAL